MNNQLLCQQYLNIVYSECQLKRPKINQNKSSHMVETYGEILYSSVNKLLSIVPPKQEDVFFDLGSGIGRVVAQVFLQTPVKAAYGIEISPALCQQATLAMARIEQELPQFYQDNRTIKILCGDFLKIPLCGATIVLIISTCFTQDILFELGKIINHTSTIHSVFSLRPIATLERLSFRKVIQVECSWDSALCYLYSSKPC